MLRFHKPFPLVPILPNQKLNHKQKTCLFLLPFFPPWVKTFTTQYLHS